MKNMLEWEEQHFYLMRYQYSTHDQVSQTFRIGEERLVKLHSWLRGIGLEGEESQFSSGK